MEENSRLVAKKLLEIEAVFLRPNDPFTWASGIKSPIYCDNRLILTDVEARCMIENAIGDLIKDKFVGAQVIMGTATAGIPHAAIVGHMLQLPMGYVRGESKSHGRTNRIEGRLSSGDRVVVIEDLISTAGSVLKTVEALQEAGAEVMGVVSIFTYGMKKGIDALRHEGIKHYSLSDIDVLLSVAVENGYIDKEDVDKIVIFRDNPSDESWMKGECFNGV